MVGRVFLFEARLDRPPNSRSNGRAESVMIYLPAARPAVHHDVERNGSFKKDAMHTIWILPIGLTPNTPMGSGRRLGRGIIGGGGVA